MINPIHLSAILGTLQHPLAAILGIGLLLALLRRLGVGLGLIRLLLGLGDLAVGLFRLLSGLCGRLLRLLRGGFGRGCRKPFCSRLLLGLQGGLMFTLSPL